MINYLSVENVTYHYGDLALFDNINFGVSEGQKVALIAKNGAGKTTLFNILTGQFPPQEGEVTFRKGIRVGYLSQDPELCLDNTVMQELFFAEGEAIQTIRQYEEALHHHDMDALSRLTSRMDHLNAWDYESRIKQILAQLKITRFDQQISELSGGQRKRVALAKVLITEPDFILLDEPTNHLDLDMIEWLEQYLGKSKSTLLMITHDRYFLDRVCNHILELDNQTIYQYQGNYPYYLEKREERIAMKSAEVEKARNLLRKEQEWMNRMPQARATKAKYRIDAFYELKDVASQRLGGREMELGIQGARLGSKILEMDGVCKAYDDLVMMKDFTYKFARNEKVGIIGNNGTGKTTFLNMISGQIAPDSGTIEIGETVVFGYYRQQGIVVDDDKRVIDVISEISEKISLGDGQTMSASQFLRYFMFPNEMHYVQVAKLSGGERKRLHLMTVLMRNPNFLILDEPTNDLDIFTLNVLEDYLRAFKGCLIIVSHDRYFMDKVVDHVFVFQGNGVVKDFPGNYTEFQDYRKEQDKIKAQEKPADKRATEAKPAEKKADTTRKLSFKEKRELEQLEADIAALEDEKNSLETALSSGTLTGDELTQKSMRVGQIIEQLEEKEMRWLELSEI
ncbi:MAG: ABC-F family ATP-binding cassette domain-containing protein [Marinilabiliaceae bacterium]|nr:ABC-F family ATP-binding cassette domain-containing protein [Marinilabiliaceae bacterium]